MSKKNLSSQDIHNLAKLANLQITEDEVEKYKKQLVETLNYIENLNELDTVATKPTAHTSDQKNIFFEDGTSNNRNLKVQEALANAENKKDPYFIVKRIM